MPKAKPARSSGTKKVAKAPKKPATGYGLGKAGWVSLAVAPADAPPLEMMTAWIDESFCAVAPKRAIAKWRAAGAA